MKDREFCFFSGRSVEGCHMQIIGPTFLVANEKDTDNLWIINYNTASYKIPLFQKEKDYRKQRKFLERLLNQKDVLLGFNFSGVCWTLKLDKSDIAVANGKSYEVMGYVTGFMDICMFCSVWNESKQRMVEWVIPLQQIEFMRLTMTDPCEASKKESFSDDQEAAETDPAEKSVVSDVSDDQDFNFLDDFAEVEI